MNWWQNVAKCCLKVYYLLQKSFFFVFFSKKLQKLVIIEVGLFLQLADYYIHTEFQRLLSGCFFGIVLLKLL